MERLSDWELRQRAELEGYTVAQDDLRKIVDTWKMIQPGADGLWSPDDVCRLCTIGELADTARRYERRVLLLRCDYLEWPIPPGPVQKAVVGVLRSMELPATKMKRYEDAIWWISRQSFGDTRPRKRPAKWLPMLPKSPSWADYIERMAPARFEARLPGPYATINYLLEAYRPHMPDTLLDIPLEERLALAYAREFVTDQMAIEEQESKLE
jgi:hypothetical protein